MLKKIKIKKNFKVDLYNKPKIKFLINITKILIKKNFLKLIYYIYNIFI